MLIDELAGEDHVTLSPPASEEVLRACELVLGHALPGDLRALLAESDGVMGEYDLNLVWSVSRIAKDNAWFRTSEDYRQLYMSFDDLVFFGDAGNGDQFTVSRRGLNNVYVWNHEDDRRTWVASTPAEYLRR